MLERLVEVGVLLAQVRRLLEDGRDLVAELLPLLEPVREGTEAGEATASAVGVLQRATLRMMIWKCKDDGVFTPEEAQRLLETLDPAQSG